MARNIKDIQNVINLSLSKRVEGLSESAVAEWKLLTYVMAAAIHSFELMHDLFREEVENLTNKITAGTVAWYREMCYRFQFKKPGGDNYVLEYDPDTAMYYYPVEDTNARIIKAVAIVEGDKRLAVKVAKEQDGELCALDDASGELAAFRDYIKTISMAGIPVEVISQPADVLRYTLTVYYDPVIPRAEVHKNILDALEQFKTSLSFNSMFYKQRLFEAVMAVEGVVTLEGVIYHKPNEGEYNPVNVMEQLTAGYFNFAPAEENLLELISILEDKDESKDQL